MSNAGPPAAPSFWHHKLSGLTLGLIGGLSRAFLLTCAKLETHGLDEFVQLLEERKDPAARQRGLVTGTGLPPKEDPLADIACAIVANHLSVLDDPVLFGALPFRFLGNPDVARWSLGSHDIAFKGPMLSTFFALGQTLPTHRLAYSPHGGPFQSTMTQAIRLLSRRPFQPRQEISQRDPALPSTDPFSASELVYSTTGTDEHWAPSAYASRRYSWVHIFPEGKIHQHPHMTMRYFKWGVARLLLESEPCPDLVPIWIEGFEQIMPEERGFPRPMPRPGATVHVAFGAKVDVDQRFGDLRQRWRDMVAREQNQHDQASLPSLGECPVALQQHPEAVQLRQECAMRVREEVLKVRKQRGWGDEDPKARFVDTWRVEGAQREGLMSDGSRVKEGPL